MHACSPPYDLNTLLVTDWAYRAQTFVALHLPCDFVANAKGMRLALIQHYLRRGLLKQIYGLPLAGNKGRSRCGWCSFSPEPPCATYGHNTTTP